MSKFLLLVTCFFVFISFGCNKKSQKSIREPTQRSFTAPTDRFKLTVASGGGFTGAVTGYTLHSDGAVEHWLRFPGKPDSIIWTAKGSPAEILKFRQQLEASGMLQERLRESGNMTTSVTYAAPDTTYLWSWSESAGAGKKSIQEWVQAVQTFCETINQQREQK